MAKSNVYSNALEPAVYSAEEVAMVLGVSQATVYAMANGGKLPCKRVGRRFIFSRAAIHAWLESPAPVDPWHG